MGGYAINNYRQKTSFSSRRKYIVSKVDREKRYNRRFAALLV